MIFFIFVYFHFTCCSGPIDEFVDAMYRLASYMKQQNSRETQVRGMRELEAINGEKGI